MISNNPLKQYFRRPTLYISLNNTYSPDVMEVSQSGEYAVYPMTAIDEITSRTPDALLNGIAVIEIIKSCVPNVINPYKLTSEDIDKILIAIKIASNGEFMDIDSVCPSCSEELRFSINLSELLAQNNINSYNDLFVIGDLKIKFKSLEFEETNKNGFQQFEIQKKLIEVGKIENEEEKIKQQSIIYKELQSYSLQVLTNLIDFIETTDSTVSEKEYISDYLMNCDKNTYSLIKKQAFLLREKNSLKPLNFKCTKCQHEYKQSLVINITDFFA